MSQATRAALLLAAGLWLAPAAAAAAEVPDWRAFRTADGSFATEIGGDLADPYFVNKSLIMATEAGMDVRPEVQAWLVWLLPRQRRDGGFDRFCGARTGQWVACLAADADDSMAATTLQLLTLARQRGWIAARHAARVAAAERAATGLLRSLRDDANGLYRVFAAQPTYYLMDNLEVLDALRLRRDPAADALASAIRGQFRDGASWRPSIPPIEPPRFYPHALAHSYLWHSGVLAPSESGADIAAWLAHHSATWLDRQTEHFAWGIVAWNIHALAPAEAGCWRLSVRQSPARLGWTVLDAMADAALAHRGVPAVCARRLAASSTSQEATASESLT